MKLTPEKLTAFCAALAETGNVGKACAAIGISRQCAYNWRDDIPEFARAWDEAVRVSTSMLEDEATRRAVEGVEEPLSHQGRFSYLYREAKDENGDPILDPLTGTPQMEPVLDEHGNHKVAAVRKYSDTLLIFLLKAHNPAKYRENTRVELTGANGGPVEMTEPERVKRLKTALAAVRQRATADDVGDLLD